jgi:16S rRNA (guanine966-N2)-methyltransferase
MLASAGALVPGGRVLDLYAGSGALAFEALSRGAGAAVLVEHGRDALSVIRENARALGVESDVRIVAAKVERALGQLEAERNRFDLVFLDPPYASVPTPGFAEVLAGAADLLADEGMLVVEHSPRDAPPAVPALEAARSRTHGDTCISLFRRPGPLP